MPMCCEVSAPTSGSAVTCGCIAASPRVVATAVPTRCDSHARVACSARSRHGSPRAERESMRPTPFAIALLLSLPACATIVASGPDLIPVNSSPEGARVLLDGQPIGVTPTSIAFARKCEGLLTLELDGFQPRVVDVDKVVNGWFFGNILFGGPIGMAIDLIASNQGKYPDGAIFVELVPVPARPLH